MNILITTLNAKYIHSSLALRYLRSYCREEFPELQLVEYTINDLTMNIVADIYKRRPDLVAFSCYIWNIRETIDVIKNLKKVMPDVPIVLGGPEVSYDTDMWMKRVPEFNFIVIGEGEETFLELLREIRKERTGDRPDYESVKGIAYRDGEKVRFTQPRGQIEDLNTIPSPYEKHLDELNNRIVYFEASRGCPFKCQFCLSSIEDGVRYFDMERVKKDLKRLIDHGVKTIKFVDRTFNIHKKYALEIFEFLIKHHNGTVFQFEITADIMKPDVIDYLVEHAPPGVFRFEVGVQSTNDETNRLVMRRQDFEKLSRTVTRLKESGKFVQHLDLIAGLPEENYASFRKTFNDVFALEPEELQLGFLKMLRGTGVRARAAEHDYIYMDEAPYEILSNNVLSFDEILRLKRIEDILEKYWNDHRLDHTVHYLIRHEFASAFDFFQEFGDYWEEKGWNRIGHQLQDLFQRLHMFLRERGMRNPDVVESLLKYDYLIHQKVRPRSVWWERPFSKEESGFIYQQILEEPERLKPVATREKLSLQQPFKDLNLTERDLHKHTFVEKVSGEMLQELDANEFYRAETVSFVMLVYYDPEKRKKGGPLVYAAPFLQTDERYGSNPSAYSS
ncbi:MAG: B12-binding domain-containing radical SAM protein [Bacillaceae bacterium]|nr:B12-binding domain-containing radical SAM protein [Bacillaceae bacterium]